MTIDQQMVDQIEKNQNCAKAYNEKDFWNKLSILPRSTIRQGLEKILLLREVLVSSGCPLWARAAVLTGFGYLIIPTDLIPDVLPGVGYLDDLAMIGLIIQRVDALITEEMRTKVSKRIGGQNPHKQQKEDGGEHEALQHSG